MNVDGNIICLTVQNTIIAILSNFEYLAITINVLITWLSYGGDVNRVYVCIYKQSLSDLKPQLIKNHITN